MDISFVDILVPVAILSGAGIIVGLFLLFFGEVFKVDIYDAKRRTKRRGKKSKEVAFIACSGDKNKTDIVINYEGKRTCRAAAQYYGGQWNCEEGCLGLGDCAKVCDAWAIVVENGLACVNRSKCVGCGNCVVICPNNIISLVKRSATVQVACSAHKSVRKTKKICAAGCLGCGDCISVCEEKAIKVRNNLACIDEGRCNNCGACVDTCTRGTIIDIRKERI